MFNYNNKHCNLVYYLIIKWKIGSIIDQNKVFYIECKNVRFVTRTVELL